MVQSQLQRAQLKCNERWTVFGTFANEAEAEQALAGMAGTELTSQTCPHCGDGNVFRGSSSMEACTCPACGRGVRVVRSVQ